VRLFLEAEPGEILERGETLLHELAHAIGPFNPDLEEALTKALPHKESQLKYRVLKQLQKKTSGAYQAMLEQMLQDIGKVVDKGAKTTLIKALIKQDEEGEGEEEEPLEPGDYDPETDTVIPEPEEPDEKEGEETEKSYDRSKPIADADAVKYERVKAELCSRGYKQTDFEEGGPFYGWSVNELIDFANDNLKG
jgi:hypothetical protein